jgi:hypothetical protein
MSADDEIRLLTRRRLLQGFASTPLIGFCPGAAYRNPVTAPERLRAPSSFHLPAFVAQRRLLVWQFSADPYLDGLIDELRIYWGALTSDEIGVLARS